MDEHMFWTCDVCWASIALKNVNNHKDWHVQEREKLKRLILRFGRGRSA